MTTVKRRKEPPPRYQVLSVWDQEGSRPMWCVIDRDLAAWARGVNSGGYTTEAEADAVCARLRHKEKK